SFDYQTDTLLFYFDPEDKINTETIVRNMNSGSIPVSVGLLKDELVLAVLTQNFAMAYDSISNFTTDDLLEMIESFGEFSPLFLLFLFVFLIVYNLMMYIIQFFPIVLFSNIVSVYRRTGLRFLQTAKVALLATILPSLGLYIVNAFFFN